MRAISGFVVSTKPCSLGKAARILERFSDSAASHLPSSDCATYLQTAAVATQQHHLFRRDQRANRLQCATNLYAHEDEVPESDRNQPDRERYGDMAVPAGGSHDSAAEAELAVGAGWKKGKKRKKKEDPQEDGTAAGVALHSPNSREMATEKRMKKGKHSNEEIASVVKQEAGLVAQVELGSEEKGKKKKVKDHVKLEEDVGDVKEPKGQMVNNGVTGQGVAGAEKKRKKKMHAEEQGYVKDVKEEEKTVADGDLGSEKKRKKKRGRGDDDDNDQEQAKHSKKQRKQS